MLYLVLCCVTKRLANNLSIGIFQLVLVFSSKEIAAISACGEAYFLIAVLCVSTALKNKRKGVKNAEKLAMQALQIHWIAG
jgi:hypothetical protein